MLPRWLIASIIALAASLPVLTVISCGLRSPSEYTQGMGPMGPSCATLLVGGRNPNECDPFDCDCRIRVVQALYYQSNTNVRAAYGNLLMCVRDHTASLTWCTGPDPEQNGITAIWTWLDTDGSQEILKPGQACNREYNTCLDTQ